LKRVAGAWTTLATMPYMLSTGVYYTIALEMRGERIMAYLDGVLQHDVIDSPASFTRGRIAVRAYMAHDHYNNILVRA